MGGAKSKLETRDRQLSACNQNLATCNQNLATCESTSSQPESFVIEGCQFSLSLSPSLFIRWAPISGIIPQVDQQGNSQNTNIVYGVFIVEYEEDKTGPKIVYAPVGPGSDKLIVEKNVNNNTTVDFDVTSYIGFPTDSQPQGRLLLVTNDATYMSNAIALDDVLNWDQCFP